MYDVVIIGAGVSGCAIARELSRYRLKNPIYVRELQRQTAGLLMPDMMLYLER